MSYNYEYNTQNEMGDAAFDWVENHMKQLDDFYKKQIPNDNLRLIFLKSLAYSYWEKDPLIENELKKCDFDMVHYHFLMNEGNECIALYKKHLMDEKEWYDIYENRN